MAVSRVVLKRSTMLPNTTMPKNVYPKKMGNTAVMYCAGWRMAAVKWDAGRQG